MCGNYRGGGGGEEMYNMLNFNSLKKTLNLKIICVCVPSCILLSSVFESNISVAKIYSIQWLW